MGSAQNALPANRRKPELSYLNVLFCILVVLIHVESQSVTSLTPGSWQYALVAGTQRLSFISVYGFFFLSGLKLFLTNKSDMPFSYGRFYRKRFQSILLPYLIAVTLYELLFLYMNYTEFSLSALLRHYLIGDISAQFYFLVTLVQMIVLTPLFRWIVRRWSPLIILPIAVLVSWLFGAYLPSMIALVRPDYWFPYSDRVFPTYLVYYLAGCYAGEHYADFHKLSRDNLPLTTALTVVFGGLDAAAAIYAAVSGTVIVYRGLLQMGYLLCGILALFGWATKLAACRAQLPRPAAALDRVSYLIYLYHCAVLTWWNDRITRSGITNAGILLLLRAVAVYGITISLCLLWRHIADRVKTAWKNTRSGGA